MSDEAMRLVPGSIAVFRERKVGHMCYAMDVKQPTGANGTIVRGTEVLIFVCFVHASKLGWGLRKNDKEPTYAIVIGPRGNVITLSKEWIEPASTHDLHG